MGTKQRKKQVLEQGDIKKEMRQVFKIIDRIGGWQNKDMNYIPTYRIQETIEELIEWKRGDNK